MAGFPTKRLGFWEPAPTSVADIVRKVGGGFPTYAKAAEKFAELTADRRPTGEIKTVADLVNLWFTKNRKKDNETTRFRLKPWWVFEGDVLLRDFTRNGLKRYVEYLENEPLKKTNDGLRPYGPHTIRDMAGLASQVCKWGYENEHLPELPVRPKLPAAPQKNNSIPLRKLAKALADLPERARRVAVFLLATGVRPGIALKLDWGEVDLDEKVITLDYDRHKTGWVIRIWISSCVRSMRLRRPF